MLRTVADKEVRDIVTSTKFAVAFGVCALLIIAAFYIGATHFNVSQEQYEASKAANIRQMEGVTDWMQIQQHRIFLPPRPLAALVSGVSNDIGRTVEIVGQRELTARDSKFNEEPIFAVFRLLDLEFIFQVVLSLFAILLGYDAISGEKEKGTLRLSLANALPRSTYILGKFIGSFAALSVALLVAIAIGCLLLPVLGISLTGEEWARLGLIILVGLLYFGVFLAASIFVSSLTHRSSNSFLLLLVMWIMTVMVIPRTSILLAGRAVDVPSVDEIDAEKATHSAQLWKEFRTDLSGFKPPVNSQGSEAIERTMDEFNKYMDSLTTLRNEKTAALTDRLNESRRNAQASQQRLAFDLARLTPTTSLALATGTLAGTSLDLKSHFLEEALAYREGYFDFMEEKTGMNMRGGGMFMRMTSGGEEPEPINPRELPEFQYQPATLAASVQSALVDMGILALFNLLFFAGGVMAFLKYDAR